MSILVDGALLLLGFVALVKGADFLIEGAVSLARRFKISDLIIGLTVVAFGTSLPELFVSIIASNDGSSGLLIGNILGSNISNILLIMGCSAIFYKINIKDATVWNEIPFSLLAAIVVVILANHILIDGLQTSQITRSDGLILLSFFAIFLYYIYTMMKNDKENIGITDAKYDLVVSVSYIIAGIIGLYLGGEWVVNSAVSIANFLGISQALIGLTIVAIGTSLPELVTSILAAIKKNPDLAVGNIVGSNIFNIFFVLAIASLINPISFEPARNLDILVVVLSSLALFLFALFGKKKMTLQRSEGIILLLMYVLYILYLVLSSVGIIPTFVF